MDEFIKHFGWLQGTLSGPVSDFFAEGSEEYAIIERLKEGFGKRDTAELLKSMTAEYGDKAGETVEEYLKLNIQRDWAGVGKRQAHEGTEIEDFIRVLWEPLKSQGFEFTSANDNGKTTFCVTKCPLFDLAEKTGLHKWLYHLGCSTDFHTAGAFCPKIAFNRTKSMMEGHEYCNHQYYYR